MPKGTTSKYAKKQKPKAVSPTRQSMTRRAARSAVKVGSKGSRPTSLRSESAAMRQAQTEAIGATKSTIRRSAVSKAKASTRSRVSARGKAISRRS